MTVRVLLGHNWGYRPRHRTAGTNPGFAGGVMLVDQSYKHTIAKGGNTTRRIRGMLPVKIKKMAWNGANTGVEKDSSSMQILDSFLMTWRGWRRGVAVTELIVSTKLLYVEPG